MSYRPAEIGGIPVGNIPSSERAILGKNAPTCPFTGDKCNKKHSVCSLVKHTDQFDLWSQDKSMAALCPHRFKQDDLIFRYVETLMQELSNHPIRRYSEFALPVYQEADVKIDDPIGDFLFRAGDMYFCLELQSVYFSGDKMSPEIEALRASTELNPSPIGDRHPDVLSAMKRLWWQLEQKLRLMRQINGKAKMVVVIDGHFAQNMPLRQKNLTLQQADIIWLILRFVQRNDGSINLDLGDLQYSTMEPLREAIFGAKLNQQAFLAKVA